MDVGYLADVFDLLNVRDLDVIEQASNACDRLIVGVFSDAYAEQALGYRPVVPLDERIELVSHVRGVAAVQVHDEAVEPAVPIFGLSDRPTPTAVGAPLLTPRRGTTSPLLQHVLWSQATGAVA